MQRHTKQQELLSQFILKMNRPYTVKEIHEEVLKDIPSIGQATVYRALKKLIDSGKVVQIKIQDKTPYYEVSSMGHHHHFHCRLCNKVFDIFSCAGDVKKLCPKNFTLEEHELNLYGVCEGCSSSLI